MRLADQAQAHAEAHPEAGQDEHEESLAATGRNGRREAEVRESLLAFDTGR